MLPWCKTNVFSKENKIVFYTETYAYDTDVNTFGTTAIGTNETTCIFGVEVSIKNKLL